MEKNNKNTATPEELFARGKACYDNGDFAGARKHWTAAAKAGDENARTALTWIPDPDFEIKDGVLVKYNGRGGNVKIPNGVTSIGYGAFYKCSSLTNIAIPNSVTSIGDCAFWDCNKLTRITIPNSVTSIGMCAFGGCSGLTSIMIPNSVTSFGEGTFANCNSLTSITIPNSVTSIVRSAFSGCSGLTSITIPNSVMSIGEGAFSYCSGLTSITIPNSVTNIRSRAFYWCSGLTSITIPNSVTSIGEEAFYYCSGLTSIIIPNGVTSIGDRAFWGCSGLTSISVSSGNEKYFGVCNCIIEKATKTLVLGCKNSIIPNDGSVTSIGDSAFRSCSSLTSITIPNGVTSIGEEAFSYCSGLTSITIPNSVISIGDRAFDGCSGLTIYCEVSSNLSGWNSSWNYSSCPVVWDCNNNDKDSNGYSYAVIGGIRYSLKDWVATIVRQSRAITVTVIPSSVTYNGGAYSVTSIGEEAFSYCSGLASITIPNSVTIIGDRAFDGCNGLTDIYCDAESKPDGWDDDWLGDCKATVHWGYDDDGAICKQK